MKKIKRLFDNKNQSGGSMLMELLLSVALAAIVIPFAFQYHQKSVRRAENIEITKKMQLIQSALEKHIVAKREELLKTIGRNISRVNIEELAQYGLPDGVLEKDKEKYQLRILKTPDTEGGATLQGIIVRAADDISPIRTREIVGLSGGSMGFIDGTHAYGTFGAWHTNTIDLGTDIKNAIVETTNINRDNALYLWRVPSENSDDAKMMSALNLGGHDIKNINNIEADFADFTERINAQEISTRDLIFKNRTTLDKQFDTTYAVVSGRMSSDSKDMEVTGNFSLADTAKLSSLTAENLWVTDMTLGGLSIDDTNDFATLKINQSLDMTSGRIEAIYVTVGYAGSITPKLVVRNRIEDSVNPGFFWDADSKSANFSDASFVELNRMATLAYAAEGDKKTDSGQIFGAVSANKNATVADFMNAISQIQKQVRAKYQNLQF